MRAAAAALVAALAVVAAGCGSSSSTKSFTPLELVSQAVSKTTKTTSAKFHLSITETVGPVGPLTITGDGVSDMATHSAQMTMDMSSVGQIAGMRGASAADWKGDFILDGSNGALVEYMRLPVLSKLIPTAKPWLKIDADALAGTSGVNFSQLLQSAGNQDPTQALQMIQSVGNVQKVGTEQVGGVDTTKYSGTVDPKKIAKKYGSSGLGKYAKQIGSRPIPITVWIDGDGYVRKFEESISGRATSAGTMDMKMSVELSDFGTHVSIAPPPADQTTDIAQLLKQK